MRLEKVLENYDLTKKQAKVYLACLELGSASVQKISQRAGLARSTGYEALESLRRRGLVSTFRKKKTKYFTAETPEKIVEETQKRAKLLKESLPRLLAMQYRAGVQPTVRFYQGKQGMRTVLEEILNEADEFFGFSSVKDIFNCLENYFPKFVQKRIKRKIPIKIIMRESPEAQERKRLGPQELRQVKIMPSQYKHHGIILIWKHKIAMLSLKKEFTAVVIESEELTAIQKATFNYMWDSLPD